MHIIFFILSKKEAVSKVRQSFFYAQKE
ncbi:hypothetical protein PMI13_02555, partial [Chryseobacterium populi]